VIAGDPATTADEADVAITTRVTDVRCKAALAPCTGGTLSDYTGTIEPVLTINFTDSYNGGTGNESATGAPPVFQPPFRAVVPCAATAGTAIGSTCSLTTSVDALVSGAVKEGKRAVWELGQIRVLDGGSDGSPANDERTTFATQGLFAP
jgi:hypothetical protein